MIALQALFSNSILAAASTTLLVAGDTPLAMIDGVRDKRYCEFFVVKREEAHLEADVYNTLGLNDCPQEQWDAVDIGKLKASLGAVAIVRNGPRHFIMDKIASGDIAGQVTDMQGLPMRFIARMHVPLLALLEKRSAYEVRTIERTTKFAFSAGKPVFELIDPTGRVYVMQAYAQIVDPNLTYGDLVGLGARLKLPEGWRYRSRTLADDLVATAGGQAQIVQDDLQNTYQLLTPP
jgi:hypothetical protein